MAITRTAKGTNTSKASGSTLTIASVAMTTGDLLVVSLAYDDQTLSTVKWGTENLTLQTAVLGAGVRTRLAWKTITTGGTQTITATWSANLVAKAMVASSYHCDNGTLVLTPGVEVNNTGTGTAASTAASSAIVGGTNSILAGVVGIEGPSGDTAGTWVTPATNGQRVGTTGNPANGNVTVSEAYTIAPTAGSTPALSKTGMTSRDWGAELQGFYWALPVTTQSGSFTANAVIKKTIVNSPAPSYSAGPWSDPDNQDLGPSSNLVWLPDPLALHSWTHQASGGNPGAADGPQLNGPISAGDDATAEFGIEPSERPSEVDLVTAEAVGVPHGTNVTKVGIDFDLKCDAGVGDETTLLFDIRGTTPAGHVNQQVSIFNATSGWEQRHMEVTFPGTQLASTDTHRMALTAQVAGISGGALKVLWDNPVITYYTGSPLGSGGFTANAVIAAGSSIGGSFTANAVIKRNQTGSFTANAVIKRVITAATLPALVGSDFQSSSSATSLTFTVPAAVEAGDLLMIHAYVASADSATWGADVSGWTNDIKTNSGVGTGRWILYKTAGSGDAGSTVQITLSPAVNITGLLTAHRKGGLSFANDGTSGGGTGTTISFSGNKSTSAYGVVFAWVFKHNTQTSSANAREDADSAGATRSAALYLAGINGTYTQAPASTFVTVSWSTSTSFVTRTEVWNWSSGGFTVNAVIAAGAATQSGSFTANAVVKKTGIAGSFTADAIIARPILTDTFTRTVAGSLGTSDNGVTYRVLPPTGVFGSDFSVGGSTALLKGLVTNLPVLKRGLIAFDFHIGTETTDVEAMNATLNTGARDGSAFTDLDFDAGSLSAIAGGQFVAFGPPGDPDPNVWYRVKYAIGANGDFGGAKLWVRTDPEPDWSASGTYSGLPSNNSAYPISYFSSLIGGATGPDHLEVDNLSVLTFDSATGFRGGFSLDAVIAPTSTTVSSSFTANATIRKTQTGSFTTNAVTKRAQAGALTADSTLRRTQAGSFTANAFVPGRLTAAAVIRATRSSSFTVSAFIPGKLTANAVLRKTQTGTFTISAWVQGLTTAPFSIDAVKKATQAGALTADAVRKATQSSSLTVNAVRRAAQSGSFTANTVIRRTQAGSFTADATTKATRSGSFTADAVRRATQAGSFTANAVIKSTLAGALTANAVIESTRAGSFTADAVRKATVAGSFTANAAIKTSAAGSFTANALLLRVGAGSLTANAVLFRNQSGSFTIQSFVQGTGVGAFALDAIRRQSQTGSFTVDAYLAAGTQFGSFTANADIRRSQSGAATADAVIARTSSASFSANAVIKRTLTGSSTVDAVLRASATGSFTANASIRKTQAASFTISAAVTRTQANTFTADAAVFRSGAGSFTIAATIRRASTGSVAVDAALRRTQLGGITAEAVTQATQSGSLTLNAFIAAHLSLDAVVRRTQTGSLLLDAFIPGRLTEDAVIRRTQSGSLSVSAFVQGSGVAVFSLDAVLRRAQSGSYTADAIKQATGAGSLAANALIRKAQASSFTLNATLRHPVSGTLTTDAVLRATATGTFTLNARVSQTVAGSVTASAVLLRAVQGSFSAQAVLFSTRSGTFTISAIRRVAATGSLTLDAVIEKTTTASITASAVTKAPRTAGVTVNAVILSPRSGSTSLDAYVSTISSSSFTLDAVVSAAAAASSFTVNAVLRGTEVGSFTASAVIRVAHHGQHEAQLNARTMASLITTTSTMGATLVSNGFAAATLSATTAEASLHATMIEAVTFLPRVGSFSVDAVIV